LLWLYFSSLNTTTMSGTLPPAKVSPDPNVDVGNFATNTKVAPKANKNETVYDGSEVSC
jgi:hypothetical protein